MPLDFPSAPNNGQSWIGSNGVEYIWDGTKWVATGTAGGSGAYLPLAGGVMLGPMGTTPNGQSVPTQENTPTLDFLGNNITIQRQITNASGPEQGANPKVIVNLENYASNYILQPWGGYDGPTSLFAQAIAEPGSNGSVTALDSRIISQGNNPYGSQDTAHFVSVIKTGQNSCWAIAIQHQDVTGLPPQDFATVGIEDALLFNGPDAPQSQYDCTYSYRYGMTIIPNANAEPAWAANTAFSQGTAVAGTPAGGAAMCYVATNSGTSGAAAPAWPTSGNVTDGTIVWETGTTFACELGVGIMIGGGRPQLPNQRINTGIGFNQVVGNACIDTTLSSMAGINSAAIRLAPDQVIDFTGGFANSNKNRRTLSYSSLLNAMIINTPGGAAISCRDDGSFVAPYMAELASSSNRQNVMTGYNDTALTICRNIAGQGAINFITGDANHVLFYNTNGSGTIGQPWLTLGSANSIFAGPITVGAGAATWNSGTGAPTITRPAGSLYSRTDGAVGTHLYVSAGGGTWNAVAGV